MIAFFFQAQGCRSHEGLSCSQQKQPERRHQERPPRASPGPRAGLGCDVRHVGAARSRRFRVQPPCGTTASMAHCCVLCSSRRTTTGARGGDVEHRRLILPSIFGEGGTLHLRRGARWLPPSMHAHAHHDAPSRWHLSLNAHRRSYVQLGIALLDELASVLISPTPSYLQLKFLASTCIPRLRKHRSTLRAACIARSCSRA